MSRNEQIKAGGLLVAHRHQLYKFDLTHLRGGSKAPAQVQDSCYNIIIRYSEEHGAASYYYEHQGIANMHVYTYAYKLLLRTAYITHALPYILQMPSVIALRCKQESQQGTSMSLREETPLSSAARLTPRRAAKYFRQSAR